MTRPNVKRFDVFRAYAADLVYCTLRILVPKTRRKKICYAYSFVYFEVFH